MAEPNRAISWTLLVATTCATTSALHVLALPAAALLGPLLSAILVAARRPGLSMPTWTVTLGQAVVGCVIASAMGGVTSAELTSRWPLLAAIAVSTMLASGAIGYALARMRVVPGTVAIWGSMPGGAAAMVLMAEADGADARLVAVMVYARVLVVTMAATVLATLTGAETIGPTHAPQSASLGLAVAVAAGGMGIAAIARWPAGTLVVTMAAGMAAQWIGWGVPRVPPSASMVAFALIGWRIGLTFSRDARGAALRMLPRIALAGLALSSLCGLLAVVIHVAMDVDLLTAWLATSPGGLESVAAISASLPVDRSFIMSAQTVRFGAVMLVGPALATWLARRSRRVVGDATR